MANTTNIEKVIEYDMSNGDAPMLFDAPFSVDPFLHFSFQFNVLKLDGIPNGVIQMLVSNDGQFWYEVSNSFPTVKYNVNLDLLGDNCYFIFVGQFAGVSDVNFVNFSFTQNGVVGGTITKAIFYGSTT